MLKNELKQKFAINSQFLVRSAPPRIRTTSLGPCPWPCPAIPVKLKLTFAVCLTKNVKFCVKVVHGHFVQNGHGQFLHKIWINTKWPDPRENTGFLIEEGGMYGIGPDVYNTS